MFSEAHCVDVHGYVLVYSINSQKRYRVTFDHTDAPNKFIFCSFEVVKVIHDKILDMMGASRLISDDKVVYV